MGAPMGRKPLLIWHFLSLLPAYNSEKPFTEGRVSPSLSLNAEDYAVTENVIAFDHEARLLERIV